MERGSVRSVNTGIKAIKFIIDLSRDLFEEGATRVFAKYMINNFVENKFSQIVARTPIPDALQFQQ
jgi:hypothetical protein